MDTYISTKPNLIIRISNGITDYFSTKDHIILEDSWIGENDEFLVDKEGIEYKILEFRIIKDYVLIGSSPYSSYTYISRSCLKLDKYIEVGKILYLKNVFKYE